MGFLNAILLWGLAAAAIPVVVHLLNKFQVRKIRWAAMRFLDQAMRRNQRKLKLEDLLLLLLRAFWLCLLVLAFARPVSPAPGGAAALPGGPTDVVLVVDDSMSMGMSNGVATRFEQAREESGKVLDSLGSGSEAALFFVSDRVKKVVPEPTRDFALIRRSLQQNGPSARASNLLPGVQAAVELLKGRSGRPKALFLFTDDQDLAWRHKADIQSLVDAAKGDIAFHLVPMGDGAGDNLAVASVKLDSGVPVANQPMRCRVEVANWGTSSAQDVRVTVAADRSAPQAEAVIPQIEPGQNAAATLVVRVDRPGYHTLTAAIPPDRLPDDNQRATAFQALDQVKVLVVEGNPGADRVDQDGFFLSNALAPVRPDERAAYYLKVAAGSPADLRAGNLGQYEVVFLAGTGKLDPAASAALAAYVKQGGGLVVLPPAKGDARALNDDPVLGPLLPAKFGAAQDVAAPNKFLGLQGQNYLHPVTALWNDADQGSLGGMRVSRFFPFLPLGATATGTGGPQVVVAYADGQPAIVDQAQGAGRVVVFGFPLVTSWGNIPIHPNFVPLVQRLVGYLTKRDTEGLVPAPGELFSHRVGIEAVGKEFSVLAPGEKEEKRVAGRVELDGQSGVIRFADTEKAGPYQVFLGDDPKWVAAFAVQSDPAESNLARASDDDLAFLLGNPGGGKGGKGGASSTVTREFWLPFLLAAFAGALLEFYLAHRFSRSR